MVENANYYKLDITIIENKWDIGLMQFESMFHFLKSWFNNSKGLGKQTDETSQGSNQNGNYTVVVQETTDKSL